MRVLMKTYLVCLVLTMNLGAMAQQRDTTSNGEELLVASALFKKSDEERRLMLLKPRFRYINKSDKPSLLKLGYRPDFGIALGNGHDGSYAPNIVLAYEKLFKNSPFSWSIEALKRLGDRPLGAYEYTRRTGPLHSGAIGGRWQPGGQFYNHRFRVHTTLRYYYNMNKRRKAEISGHNMASEYVFFRMRDMLAYTEVNQYDFTSERRLINHTFKKEWIFRPSYFSLGWGIQRPFLDKGLVDFNIELGRRFPTSDFIHFYEEVFFDINLFIGLGL